MLAVYWRLPRFLKGERGLFLAAVAVPGGRVEDMFPGCVVQLGSERQRELSESELRRTERRRSTEREERRTDEVDVESRDGIRGGESV